MAGVVVWHIIIIILKLIIKTIIKRECIDVIASLYLDDKFTMKRYKIILKYTRQLII